MDREINQAVRGSRPRRKPNQAATVARWRPRDQWLPRVLEGLEERILLDSEPFPTPITALAPNGSLVFSRQHSAQFAAPNETDSFEIRLDPGQKLSAVLRPLDSSIQAKVELHDPSSALVGEAMAAAAGQPVVLQVGLPDVAG